MIRILLVISAVFCMKTLSAQLTPLPGKVRVPTRKEEAVSERNQNCLYSNRYTAEQRLHFYPFSKATAVKLVSFQSPAYLIIGSTLPMKNGKVDTSQLKEAIILGPGQVDTLTDLMYNWRYTDPFFTTTKYLCYEPHNAILFFNAAGDAFAFLEICFQCTGYRTNSKQFRTGDFCQQKYELLKQFFEKHEVYFGTTQSDF